MFEWIDACLTAMGMPGSDEDRIAGQIEALRERRGDVADRLWRARKLRGAATDPQLRADLQTIDDALTTARQACDRPSLQSLRDARLRLDAGERLFPRIEARAEALERSQQTDLLAMPAYFAALTQARTARDEIAGLVGAKTQLDELDALLARGQAAVSGVGGYASGRTILAGHVAVLAAARTASRTFEARLDPHLVTRREAIRAKLTQHRLVAPEAQTRLHEAALAQALAKADEGTAVADAAMTEVGARIDEETRTLRQAKQQCEELVAHVGDWMARLTTAGVSAARRAPYQHLLEDARDHQAPQRDYPRAVELLTECLRACQELQSQLDQQNGQWADRRQQIEKMRTFALGIRKEMPQFRSAHLVIEKADAMLQAEARGDVDDAVAQLPELERLSEDLRVAVLAAKGDGSLQQMAQMRKATIEARDLKTTALEKKLRLLDERVGPAIAAVGTTVRRRAGAVVAPLDAMLGSPGADYLAELGRVRTTVFDELDTLGMEIDRLLRDDAALQQVIDAGQADVARQQATARPAHVDELLRELPRYKVDVAAERTERDQLLPQLDADADAAGRFAALEQRLEAKLQQAKDAHQKRVAADLELIGRIETGLANLAKSQPDWRPWFDELKLQCEDVRALVTSGDPRSRDLAVAECAELVRKMKAVDPQYRAKDAKSFADVEAKQAALAKMLGQGNVVMDNLATTFTVLRTDLEQAIAAARAASPDEGLRILGALESRIDQAVLDAAAAKVRRDAFKQRKKDVETRWQRLQSAVGMRFTDRAEAFAARLAARLSEANETSKQEGELDQAEAALAGIEAELQTIEASGDDAAKRRALQDKDAAATAELRAVADLVRQFEAERGVFESTTLPALEKALAGQQGFDRDQLNSLRQSGKHAATIVQRYLDAQSLLPHRRLLGEKAPDPAKAAADFARARKLLAEATTLARAMQKGESTSAWYSGDLQRVAGEWPRATHAYKLAMEEMATALTGAAAGEPGEVVQQATTVAARLRKLADLLPPTAFAKVVADVVGAATPNDRLAAREAGLSLVRRHRQALLQHPLLVAANDAKNPFRNALREAGIVRATLKKLELEFLGIG